MPDDRTPEEIAPPASGSPPVAAAPAPHEADPSQATRPFGEMARSTWVVFLGVWCVFFLALLALFGGRADVLFNLGVILAFGVMYFGVPFVLLRMTRAKKPPAPPTSARFVDTASGRMLHGEVLAQITLIPVLVTAAIIAIGLIALNARG